MAVELSPKVLGRPAFEQELVRAVERDELVTLGLLDLDHFKEVNDTHGHDAGDRVLTAVTERLVGAAETSGGFVARLGGDEFAIGLPGVPLEQGFLEMDRLRAGVHELSGVLPQQKDYRPSVSIGVASYPRDVRKVDDLVARADQALWQAKEAGRNQVALPTPEDMILKSNYYTAAQLGRLKKLAESKQKRESVLLREALDDLLRKYDVRSAEPPFLQRGE